MLFQLAQRAGHILLYIKAQITRASFKLSMGAECVPPSIVSWDHFPYELKRNVDRFTECNFYPPASKLSSDILSFSTLEDILSFVIRESKKKWLKRLFLQASIQDDIDRYSLLLQDARDQFQVCYYDMIQFYFSAYIECCYPRPRFPHCLTSTSKSARPLLLPRK